MSGVAYETIVVERRGQPGQALGVITLNRPERRNAYTPRMGAELRDAFGDLDEDHGIRAIVVTGAGDSFCVGADLSGGAGSFDRRGEDEQAGRDRDATDRSPAAWELRTPIIGAINGSAVGVGLTLPMQWDVRIVARDAKLGFVFNRRGVMPEANSTWLVPRLIGVSRAMELLLTGRLFSGADAAAMGLASQALDAAEVLPAALALGEDIALNVAPLSAAVTKRLVNRFLSEPDPRAAQALESRLFWWLGQQADAREGVASFLERRAPVWRLSKHAELPFDLD